jgi:hypothetical protein
MMMMKREDQKVKLISRNTKGWFKISLALHQMEMMIIALLAFPILTNRQILGYPMGENYLRLKSFKKRSVLSRKISVLN